MVRIGAMNLMLHGIDNPNFRYSDALSKSFNESTLYDVILANPPFKGSIDESDMNTRFSTKTKKTELLFIELIYDLLVTGGKAGVIVPDGVLFRSGSAFENIRKILVDKCQLQGVICMPSGVFKPYAGVSTAVLLFTKGGITDKVWFYNMQEDGFTLDDKRYPSTKNDIADIQKEWTAWQQNPAKYMPVSKNVVMVDVAEIRRNSYNLGLAKYQPKQYPDLDFKKPETSYKNLEGLESGISVTLKQIKESYLNISNDHFSNSETLEFKKIQDVAIVNPRMDEERNLPDDYEVSFIPMAAIDETDGRISIHEIRRIAEVKKGYTYFKENDVLFAKITPCMENGKAAIARGLKNGIGFGTTEFHVVRCGKEVMPEYIFAIIRMSLFREAAERNMTGSAGQKRVPTDYLKEFTIAIPPLEIQSKIADIVIQTEQLRLQQRAHVLELDQLFKGLLQKYFG
jgi:type I restriction enzyme M protein